jgi:glutathione synthase/RimK-type ligase-like ATP-grasp enzyme
MHPDSNEIQTVSNMHGDGNRLRGDAGGRNEAEPASRIANMLNRSCHCINVDKDALRRTLETNLGKSGAYSSLLKSHPHLLAESPVFLSRDHVDQMTEIIESVESVVALKAYQNLVLEWAPEIGRKRHGPRGVFYGYDFHLTNDGPKLIEINTNAGGALLILHVANAQQACCPEVENFVVGSVDLSTLEQELIAMFREELHLQFPGRELRRIAIVDENPTEQFLGPEFILFRRMFEHHGIDATVVGPDKLVLRHGELHANGRAVDLVYNRLTDFYLQSPACAVLSQAYRDDAAVFTPSPYNHALYANKRNLTVFSDPDLLSQLGVDTKVVETLAAGVPSSVMVTEKNAASLWANRRQLFFKPVWGFGGKGAYRGSKLTRRTWQSILDSSYVAQELVPPSERLLIIDGNQRILKLDVRCYVYNGEVQLVGARMYRGQTTNFRTDGGGLAAAFTAPTIAGSGVYRAVSPS